MANKQLDPRVVENMKKIQPVGLGAKNVAGKVLNKAIKGDRYRESLKNFLIKNKDWKAKSKAPNTLLRKLMK